MRSRVSSIVLGVLLIGLMGPLARRAAGREQLRVRATSEIDNVAVVKSGDGTEVSGALSDEVGQPIAGAEVGLATTASDAGHAAVCRGGDRVRASGATVFATTDGLGFFCFRLQGSVAVESSMLRYEGDVYHAGSNAAVPKETGKKRLSITFESRELVASLDSPSFVVGVTPHADQGGATSGVPIRLVLSHVDAASGTETELGATDVLLGSTARFDVETRLLGKPGAGKLIARFAGTSAFAKAEEAARIERTATTRLSVAAPVPPSDPESGVDLLVGVGSSVGAVPDGLVEASVEGRAVGIAPVTRGTATVTATFTPVRGRPSVVRLRYLPASSGFLPGDALAIAVPIRTGNGWLSLPWAIAAATLTYWIVRAWRRPARTERRAREDAEPHSRGRPAVEVVEVGAPDAGYRGRVVDAHEGTPVASARVSVVVPAFDGEGIAASHVAAPDGTFSIPHVPSARNEGARFVVTAPFHATLSGPPPPDGVLTICLVSRRRALLDRLVAWADRAGRPWTRKKDPTPLEIAEVARHRERPDVAEWATAVGEAAYGVKPPDERREQDLDASEPMLDARDER